MSIKSAQAYLARLQADSGFCRLIRDAKDAESRNQIVKSAGFVFTKVELDSVVSTLSREEMAALSSITDGATPPLATSAD